MAHFSCLIFFPIRSIVQLAYCTTFPMMSDWTLQLTWFQWITILGVGRHYSKFADVLTPQVALHQPLFSDRSPRTRPRADVTSSPTWSWTVFLSLHWCVKERNPFTVKRAILMLSKPTTTLSHCNYLKRTPHLPLKACTVSSFIWSERDGNITQEIKCRYYHLICTRLYSACNFIEWALTRGHH
jgi:hypothetical protein